MHLRRRPWVAATTIAIALGSTVAAGPVTAAGPVVKGNITPIANPASFVVDDGVWFMTPDQVPLSQPTYYVLRGEAQNGGIAFSISLTSPSSGVDAGVVEVAIDSHGQQLVAVGTPTEAFPRLDTAPEENASAPAPSGGASISPLTSSYRTGQYITYWLDPLSIITSEVADRVNWYYDGTYVTSFSGSSFWNWFSGNGWHPVGTPYVGSYYNSNHTWATVYTNAQFETSSWFPLPTCGTTDVYYQANNVYGGGNGQLSGGVNTWGTGGCMYLLHYFGFTHS